MVKNTAKENSTGLALVQKFQKMINMSNTTKDSGGEDFRMDRECTKN